MNKNQALAATAISLITIVLGGLLLQDSSLFLRLLFGLSLGFALTKGSIGFAGSVNRAYRRGSTQLLQTLMFMFVVTAILNAGLLLNAQAGDYNLWINPINIGLLVGGLMFGMGMSLSSCCASGVMVEMVSDVPRALITLVFFGAGVFIAFPLQATQPWITESVISTASYPGRGVYLPDLLNFGPLNGYFLSIIVTIILALAVVALAKKYENHRRSKGTYLGVQGEIDRAQLGKKDDPKSFKLFSAETYQNTLANMWSMKSTALVIAIIFVIMMATTSNGWGASTPFGIWFAKLLMLTGISAADIAEFTHRPEGMFTTSFFEHGISVQNLAIMIGTLIALLFMGRFKFSFIMHHSAKQYAMFALGGLLMGVGTRLANGCNVGALFTPIANFSLSGWIYLVVLLAGGILGNKLHKAILQSQIKPVTTQAAPVAT